MNPEPESPAVELAGLTAKHGNAPFAGDPANCSRWASIHQVIGFLYSARELDADLRRRWAMDLWHVADALSDPKRGQR